MPSLVNATFWSAIQRFGGLAIGFISNIVLARLLNPEDYGIVGLILVFVGVADVLIDGGLGNALIQKKSLTDKDISTVFSSNLLLSIFLFGLLFFSAPSIADYVNIERFDLFLRIEAVMIIIRALYVVHFSLINRDMDFQLLAKINIISNTLTTILAILMAILGMGVWSLILRNILLDVILCFSYCYKRPLSFSLRIYKNSLRQMIGYGFFVALSNVAETLYSSLLSFILGKKFSVKELGYYNQAYSLEQIPVYSVTSILNQVYFPFLSKEQEDIPKMRVDIQKSIMVMSFFVYPLMIYLICFAQPIIVLLYSEKWMPAVPFFQILCTLGFTNYLYHLNRSILKAIGKSRALFSSQIIGCCIGILLIVAAIPLGIFAVVIAVAFNSIIGVIIVAWFTGEYIGLNLFQQTKMAILNFIFSLATGLLSYYVFINFTWNEFILLPISFTFFVMIYGLLHFMFKSLSFQMVFSIFENYYKTKFNKNEKTGNN